MQLLKVFESELQDTYGDGVLEVDTLKAEEKYYSSKVAVGALKDVLPVKAINVQLPDMMVELIFKSERNGLSLEEILEYLDNKGKNTREGSWIENKGNLIVFIIGWHFGYTGEGK